MYRKLLVAAGAVALTLGTVTLSAQERPKITSISHLAVYTSDAAATDHYYREIIGAAKEADPENPAGVKYAFSATQYIEVLPLPANSGVNRMDHAAFNTSDAEAMRKYLAAKSWKTPSSVSKGKDGSRWFAVTDPEGNKIEFVQPSSSAKPVNAPKIIGSHVIHVGFLVHSREAEDKFYRDLLGFRPYWYGGMTDAKTDWVSQQVPDGHDWLEYMVSGGPGTGIPANMTQQTLGVLDHFAIGEHSVPDAYKKLEAENRLGNGRHDQGPKIGKDGKYQFNMYDPDGIRAELMNFKATEKPCCSPFTAPDPSE
ncbi:VOC family protein [Occallatibacter savannae]|uniref:VOC family protein n=1 Tax=Occallatibacter savannae TaxID=1002691 RepID=UPI000D69D373|nr:VOC family protein [Occallatibacter savannae]